MLFETFSTIKMFAQSAYNLAELVIFSCLKNFVIFAFEVSGAGPNLTFDPPPDRKNGLDMRKFIRSDKNNILSNERK